MINHARTLLINKLPSEAPPGEYVPAEFKPVSLPAYLKEMWLTVFDRNVTDVPQMYARANRLMSVIHGTELEDLVLALDQRVTYLPFDKTIVLDTGDLARLANTLDTAAITHSGKLLHNVGHDEIMPTLRNVWHKHPLFTYRFSALLLALIYKIESVRA